MKMEWKKIQEKINTLTDNEDYRQELWAAYLSDNKHLSLQLELIKLRNQEIEEFRHNIHYLIENPPQKEFRQLLESFDGIERTILYLLVLGYNIDDISEYKGICVVRIKQVISRIRISKRWNKWHLNDI